MTDASLRPWANERGFTLIEMIVVVAIIAIIAAFALPSITSYFQVSIETASRELSSTVKETYEATVMTGKVHRLAYDLKNGQYWAEVGPDTILLDTKASKEAEERRRRFAHDEKPPPSPFALDASVTRKKRSLPTGIVFEDVVTQQAEDPVTDGTTYTHIFPHGVTEQTIIHLKDKSNHRFSLVISPIVGRSDLYERYVTRQELTK